MPHSNHGTRTVVGVLSGTSADGITVAIARISVKNEPKQHLCLPGDLDISQVAFDTVSWSKENRETIFKLFNNPNLTIADVCEANFALGKAFAEAIKHVVARANLTLDQIDLIGSHGQTVWHNVDSAGSVTSTLQIGEAAVIAELTGVTTISDFRVADVAAGGQGAPLTSTFDKLVLSPPATLGGWRALQNIGGIGNVTFLPPQDDPVSEPVAFDTGPGNVWLDYFIDKITNGKERYDKDGQFGRKGTVNATLLEKLRQNPYFPKKPPKTTGRELFSHTLADKWIEEQRAIGCSDEDFMATLVELTAWSIADSYKRFCPGNIVQVLVSGGGSKNLYLMERIGANLRATFPATTIDVGTSEQVGIDSEAKEGMLFALLAYLCADGLYGNVSQCTFASGPRILGKITPGKNFKSLLLKDAQNE